VTKWLIFPNPVTFSKCLITNYTTRKPKSFIGQAKSLINTIKEMGNPFVHDNGEFLVLDKRGVNDEESVVTTDGSI